MTSLRCIAYISSTSHTLSDDDLEGLLVDARSFNESVKVTGVLLYNGGAFFQYFEGDTDACKDVFQRIRDSSRHHSIQILVDREIHARQFSSWSMGFSKASTSQTMAISQSQWLTSLDEQDTPLQGESSGIGMLKAFWQAASGAP